MDIKVLRVETAQIVGQWSSIVRDENSWPLDKERARQLFLDRIGQINANLFPENVFTWNHSNETLTFISNTIRFTGTDWGWIDSPIVFYKEMEVRFRGSEILRSQWRYVYVSADPWFQIGNPSTENPINSNWSDTVISDNNVLGSGTDGVFNTLLHFQRLGVNNKYTFRRGNGSNTTLTVREVVRL